jgi:hypothetical protein
MFPIKQRGAGFENAVVLRCRSDLWAASLRMDNAIRQRAFEVHM